MTPPLQLQNIFTLTHKFSSVIRDLYYPVDTSHTGDKKSAFKKENDAEHAFQLALVAWYIIDTNQIKLHKERIYELCLAHDLVEVYAGDTPLWGSTGHDDKEAREKKALEIIQDTFTESPRIAHAIEEYKKRETEEARFVYALDKLLPFTNQLFTEGKVWRERKVQLDDVIRVHEKHRTVSPFLTKYFDELLAEISAHPNLYFDC